ncbi:FliG C-terminal domain-containing protein [Parvularcula oceani]|uniref:FliG C-terminal domain-containing protein n=1 Tax=Parvularcula oceani TaxID=1247963 RepID=UPI00138E4C1C|nr:FliG C-terminal domain-containing protein [Parvularcula oceani]
MRQLAPAERVAVILSLLEPDMARSLAEELEYGGVDRVVTAFENMGTLPRPVILQVIASFVADLRNPNPFVRGGQRQAQALAERLVPAPEIDFDSIVQPVAFGIGEGASPEAVWSYVAEMPPEDLAATLADERPAVIAIVLTRLPEAKGAALLNALREPLAVAAVRHIASGRSVSGETLDAIAESLRVRASAPDQAQGTDGSATLTALLNRCPLSRQEAVLAPLRESAAETAERVEAALLRFDTLADKLPRTAAPILFREAEQRVLDTALRYGAEASPEATNFLYSNISQRLAEQIRERVASLPMPSEEEGERAQAELIATLLEWAEDGRFSIA